MLTEVCRTEMTGKDLLDYMYQRREIKKGDYKRLLREPKAAKKIEVYTVAECVEKWSKYTRPVSAYESEAAYVSDIENDYALGDVMNGGKKALR